MGDVVRFTHPEALKERQVIASWLRQLYPEYHRNGDWNGDAEFARYLAGRIEEDEHHWYDDEENDGDWIGVVLISPEMRQELNMGGPDDIF